jgi:tRNA (adenine37-N6)-methyltransferase
MTGIRTKNPIELQAIGHVQGPRQAPIDEEWAKVESEIVLEPEWHGVLDGLEDFSHGLVVFWMHEAPPPSGLRRRPRGRDDMPELGLLAQRSRHRPNRLGVTAIEMSQVHHDRLVVRGLDAIDGTPVLDIKPYVPAFDARAATVPEWMRRLMVGYF